MTTKKQTLAGSISFKGIGVHTGQESVVTIHPEQSGGIRFLKNGVYIKALYNNLESARFSLNLGSDGESIRTVEHFLAALSALNIWDATIEVKGEEMPILDGSASPITNEIEAAGLESLDDDLEFLNINEEFFIEEEGRSLQFEYYKSFYMDITIDYLHPQIKVQKWSGLMNSEVFTNEIAYARTFGFLKDEKILRAKGFALGANLDNSVIFSDKEVVNEMGLRAENEPVRHKVLDLMGDLALLGKPISGRITAFKNGHELSMKLLKRIWGKI